MTDQGTEVAEPGTEVALADDSTALATRSDQVPAPAADPHAHPDVRQYVVVAVVLVVLTAIEIATSYVNTGHTNWIITALAFMAFIKFVLVTAYYMHMKSDNPLFRTAFIVGLILACIVYGIVFLVFSSTVLKS
jgi:caa(3)-type oxidase subunit IV